MVGVRSLDFPNSTFVAVQPLVGGIVAHEPLGLRIPFEPSVVPIGEIPQVAHGHRPAANLDITNRILAAPDAIQEVFAVVVAFVETDCFVIQRLID